MGPPIPYEKYRYRIVDFADLYVHFADLFFDFADLFVDFADLFVDFADLFAKISAKISSAKISANISSTRHGPYRVIPGCTYPRLCVWFTNIVKSGDVFMIFWPLEVSTSDSTSESTSDS